MSTPKPAKESYNVKFSNKTGGAYAEMKQVIESERKNWHSKGDQGERAESKNTDTKQDKKH